MGRGWEVEGRGWEVDGEGLRGGSGSGGGWAGRWRRDQEVEREELGGEGEGWDCMGGRMGPGQRSGEYPAKNLHSTYRMFP